MVNIRRKLTPNVDNDTAEIKSNLTPLLKGPLTLGNRNRTLVDLRLLYSRNKAMCNYKKTEIYYMNFQ